MSKNAECPEGRPKGPNGTAIPSAGQIADESVRDARIAREQAIIDQNRANSPVAGHDRSRER